MVHFLRKEEKKKAKSVLRSHYGILVLCFFLTFLVALPGSFLRVFVPIDYEFSFKRLEETGEELSVENVIRETYNGNYASAKSVSERLHALSFEKKYTLGFIRFERQDGVIAAVINECASFTLLPKAAEKIYASTGSMELTNAILIGSVLLILLLISILLYNPLSVITSRISLEAYTYRRVPKSRFSYLRHRRRYFHTVWVMTLFTLWKFLLSLTIVLIPYAHYAYEEVPFLLAENPDLTGKEALSLSRRAMKGHKWERFIIDISFIGWFLLSAVSFGLIGIFFTKPYHSLVDASFYNYLHANKKVEFEPDPYIRKKADTVVLKKAYQDILAMKEEVNADSSIGYFGLEWKDTPSLHKRNDLRGKRAILSEEYEEAVGESYPNRLLGKKYKQFLPISKREMVLSCYTFSEILSTFLCTGFIGWCWEVFYSFLNGNGFVNRGFLYGPFLPIYGTGSILILILLYRFRDKPFRHLGLMFLLCGVLEYVTGTVIELARNLRYWDYDGFFCHIASRVSLEGLAAFCIGGTLATYIAGPLLYRLFKKIPAKTRTIVSVILGIFILIDFIFALFYPHTGAGIIK